MAEGALSITLRCASWQQLAAIYQRDLRCGTMFLRAASPPPVGTALRIDLVLPSATVIALDGVVGSHVQDPQRGGGVEVALAPLPASSVRLIESALASDHARGPALAAAEQDLVKALVSEAESPRKLDPFLVLGVGYDASAGDVRAAFAELTRRYHSDRFARYDSGELRQLAAEIFLLIRDAYHRLGDPVARGQILQSLGKSPAAPRAATGPPRGSGSPPRAPRPASEPPARPPPPVAAAAFPAPGPAVLVRPRSGGPCQARAHPTGPQVAPSAALPDMPAPADHPGPASLPAAGTGDSAALTALEDLEKLIEHGRLDEAVAGYRRIAGRDPGDRSARAGIELCEGLRALAARDRHQAAQRFEAALELDPSHERAARELAEMRRHATHERKGLLSRLMGKKEP